MYTIMSRDNDDARLTGAVDLASGGNMILSCKGAAGLDALLAPRRCARLPRAHASQVRDVWPLADRVRTASNGCEESCA